MSINGIGICALRTSVGVVDLVHADHFELGQSDGGRCVISGCDVVEALEAAHIVPHARDGTYATSDGLLLRADLHTLFDLHLLSVCPDKGAVQFNPQLRATYGQYEDQVLRVPLADADRPDPHGLAYHRAIWQSLL